MNDTAIDLGLSTCTKTVSHLGYTTYVNICNGLSKDVPWGNLDWLGFVALAGFGLLMGAFLVYIVLDIIN